MKTYDFPVTVIAMCFNHERFLIECLESIRFQTSQNFQLIVTDDCSRDGSAELIEVWLKKYRPDALFLRHQKNVGICKTLNEALSHAKGEYISMIATDDIWESFKIERQLEAIQGLSKNVAVVYSDASQMDEQGDPLPKNFIDFHLPDESPPSGDLFLKLLERNFIPAMATMIRLSSLRSVGGYDEQLLFEDYDMWLRLAHKYEFFFLPETVARYRIVDSSLVRTFLKGFSGNYQHSMFLIYEKWLKSGVLSPTKTALWKDEQWTIGYLLYVHGDPRAGKALFTVGVRKKRVRALLLSFGCSIGITRARAKKLTAFVRQ